MNNKIIKVLEKQLEDYKTNSAKIWKVRALRNGIDAIKRYNKVIKSGEDVKHLEGIGKGLVTRIDEILETGTLKGLKEINTEKNIILKKFTDITGVGLKRAEEWYKKGYRNISDIKRDIKNNKLSSTHHIDIGLKYHDDFQKRIPKKEIKDIGKIFGRNLKKVDKDLKFKICGSYRRGLKTSGDIDIIITNPKIKKSIIQYKYLSQVVEKCMEDNLIIDSLTSLGEKKYMGVCKLNNKSLARRIDIRCVNSYEYFAAIIYFTGSRNFNIYLRNKALKKGYKLNEYNLEKLSNKKKYYIQYEKELFEILDITYIPPTKRNT